jgi:hypothetical protein
MCSFILGAITDIPGLSAQHSNQLLAATHSLLDFLYLACYPIHSLESLDSLKAALTRFHDNHNVFIELGVQEHFHLPKLHFLCHYTQPPTTITWKRRSVFILTLPRTHIVQVIIKTSMSRWLAGWNGGRRFSTMQIISHGDWVLPPRWSFIQMRSPQIHQIPWSPGLSLVVVMTSMHFDWPEVYLYTEADSISDKEGRLNLKADGFR